MGNRELFPFNVYFIISGGQHEGQNFSIPHVSCLWQCLWNHLLTSTMTNCRKQKRSPSTPGHFAFPAGKAVVAKNQPPAERQPFVEYVYGSIAFTLWTYWPPEMNFLNFHTLITPPNVIQNTEILHRPQCCTLNNCGMKVELAIR